MEDNDNAPLGRVDGSCDAAEGEVDALGQLEPPLGRDDFAVDGTWLGNEDGKELGDIVGLPEGRSEGVVEEATTLGDVDGCFE